LPKITELLSKQARVLIQVSLTLTLTQGMVSAIKEFPLQLVRLNMEQCIIRN
jgi:hypothetical protein